MFLERDKRRLHLRLVFAGPPLSGKTETLYRLADQLMVDDPDDSVSSPQEARGRTLYFDWASYHAGSFRGHDLYCQIVTVPGQESLVKRREILITDADAVIFVADSQPDAAIRNRESLDELQPWLARGSLSAAPVVFQINKRDLPDALPVDEICAALGLDETAVVAETSAISGDGLRRAFVLGVRAAVHRAQQLLDSDRLPEGRPPIEDADGLLLAMQELEGSGDPSQLIDDDLILDVPTGDGDSGPLQREWDVASGTEEPVLPAPGEIENSIVNPIGDEPPPDDAGDDFGAADADDEALSELQVVELEPVELEPVELQPIELEPFDADLSTAEPAQSATPDADLAGPDVAEPPWADADGSSAEPTDTDATPDDAEFEATSDEAWTDEEASDQTEHDEPRSDEPEIDEFESDEIESDGAEFVEAESVDIESDESESDESESDEAESDEAETDEAETDEAEPDEAEPDEAEPDEAEPDEAEADEAESVVAEADESEPVDAESFEAESDETEPNVVESGGAESDDAEPMEAESVESGSDEIESDQDADEVDPDDITSRPAIMPMADFIAAYGEPAEADGEPAADASVQAEAESDELRASPAGDVDDLDDDEAAALQPDQAAEIAVEDDPFHLVEDGASDAAAQEDADAFDQPDDATAELTSTDSTWDVDGANALTQEEHEDAIEADTDARDQALEDADSPFELIGSEPAPDDAAKTPAAGTGDEVVEDADADDVADMPPPPPEAPPQPPHPDLPDDAVWPRSSWSSARQAITEIAHAPYRRKGEWQARIGGRWYARTYAACDTMDLARQSMNALRQRITGAGAVLSSGRCVVVTEEPSGTLWVWQVVCRIKTLNQFIATALSGKLKLKDAALWLVDASAVYLSARRTIGERLPVSLASLGREDRRTVFADFLPTSEESLPAGPPIEGLERELRGLITSDRMPTLDVPALVRELGEVAESNAHHRATVELLQALLIGH